MATSCAPCFAIFPANRHLNSRLPTSTAVPRCSLPASDHLQDHATRLRELSELDGLATTRRQLTGHVLLSILAFPALPALASDENPVGEYTQYASDEDKYSLLIPQNWIKGTGKATGDRTVTGFFPDDDSSVNVNVLITSVGADFTGLGSFGTIDAFAETLVNGIDRSWKKPPGQAARLVNSKASNGMYYVEYTVQQPGEKKRHLLSVVGMRFNGWYNRLYTVTGQYWEDDTAKYGPLLQKVVESFKLA